MTIRNAFIIILLKIKEEWQIEFDIVLIGALKKIVKTKSVSFLIIFLNSYTIL